MAQPSRTLIHVTHEAARKVGGIGAVLDGMLTSGLPYLPWSGSKDTDRLRDLTQRLVEPVVDAADELKALAAQSSFAHCRFADVAYMITAKMLWFVVRDLTRSGIIASALPIIRAS